MNIFDRLQDIVHNTVNSTFGDIIKWGSLTAKCLIKEPTDKFKLGEFAYSPNLFQVEVKKGDLPGLFEAVRAGGNPNVVVYKIGQTPSDGLNYVVLSVDATWDGKTHKYYIERYEL